MDFRIYTIDEVAEILKVCRQSVRNYINTGKLKKIKDTGAIRIEHSELEKFISGDTNE
jgi:excisionase family DNA binding protein